LRISTDEKSIFSPLDARLKFLNAFIENIENDVLDFINVELFAYLVPVFNSPILVEERVCIIFREKVFSFLTNLRSYSLLPGHGMRGFNPAKRLRLVNAFVAHETSPSLAVAQLLRVDELPVFEKKMLLGFQVNFLMGSNILAYKEMMRTQENLTRQLRHAEGNGTSVQPEPMLSVNRKKIVSYNVIDCLAAFMNLPDLEEVEPVAVVYFTAWVSPPANGHYDAVFGQVKTADDVVLTTKLLSSYNMYPDSTPKGDKYKKILREENFFPWTFLYGYAKGTENIFQLNVRFENLESGVVIDDSVDGKFNSNPDFVFVTNMNDYVSCVEPDAVFDIFNFPDLKSIYSY
jgi:hypothetical protein